MKRFLKILLLITMCYICASCGKKEKKPFGAEDIDYNKVEIINKEGPAIEPIHAENAPPSASKTIVEVGPPTLEYPEIVVEPTAELDEEPDYGGIPIVSPSRERVD